MLEQLKDDWEETGDDLKRMTEINIIQNPTLRPIRIAAVSDTSLRRR